MSGHRGGRVLVYGPGFVDHGAVDVDGLVANLDGVAADRDDPVDDLDSRVLGREGDHDIAATGRRLLVRIEGRQDMVAHYQGRLHGSTRYSIGREYLARCQESH